MDLHPGLVASTLRSPPSRDCTAAAEPKTAGHSLQPRHADPARRARDPDTPLHDHIRHLPAAPARRLIAHAIHTAIDLAAAIALDDLVHGIAAALEVHALAPGDMLLGGGEPLGHAVDDEDARGAAQRGRVGGHEPDGAGAEDGDGLARREACEREAVPACGEDVGEEREGGFVCGARGQGQGVEVGEGDAEVLRLGAVGVGVEEGDGVG